MYYAPASQQTHEDHKYGPAIPMPTTPMGVAVHHQQQHPTAPQPGLPQMHYSPYPMAPSAHSRTRRWSSGLCHCCDDPANCLVTAVCPCITFGQVAEIVDKGSTSCANSGTMYVLIGLTGFPCLFSCFYRSKMRAQYDLLEEPFADCLVHFCCETCALCQEYRELKSNGFDMGIGWEANMDRQNRGVMVAPGVVSGMAR